MRRNEPFCRPKVGTQASLYFPDATGKQAMVLGSVRKNGDSCAKTGNPNIRYFGTEHGSELELSPTAINIVSGSKEPLKLTIDDNVGITMTSHKKLVLNAKQEISLYTPKRVVIQAQSQFLAKKTSAKSGFTIESEYHFLGAVIQAEGRDRSTFPAYNDEPQKGTPPPPDPPFSWGKLLVGVVAAVAIVGAVALTVATFGAGAVIGAAVVGAALGAIGGVVMTASSDIANGKMSSAYDYLKSAAQGAVIGAICGAIFGPAVGIGGGAVVPMTGGLTTSSIGSGMFIGGSSSYIDYSIRELWDGRTPDAGKALESFAFGALLGGGFMLGGSWLARGVSKIKGMGKGGKGEGARYAKPTELFKEDTYAPNGQRIAPKNLYREMIKSNVGRETLDLIKQNNIKIRLDYVDLPTDKFGNKILGLANVNTNTVRIYVRGTESVTRTTQTIIHEVTHNSLKNPIYTQREEVIAFMREAKHIKENLSFSEIRFILNEVKKLYPNLPYR